MKFIKRIASKDYSIVSAQNSVEGRGGKTKMTKQYNSSEGSEMCPKYTDKKQY